VRRGDRVRVAVLSDVHGNLTALRAVLADIDARGPFDVIVNAGDLACGGPRPREAVDLLASRGFPTVVGNTDEWVAGAPGGPEALVAWTRSRLRPEQLQYLRGLPRAHRVEPPDGPPLVVVHATPTSTTDVVEPDAPPDLVARLFDEAGARTLVYGHIHRAYVREVAGGLLVNAGSVGFPFDGLPHAAWAALWTEDGRWRAEIRRVLYDWEAVAAELESGDHPEGATFARRVRTGRMA
jgi:predicted phosphodiesterase